MGKKTTRYWKDIFGRVNYIRKRGQKKIPEKSEDFFNLDFFVGSKKIKTRLVHLSRQKFLAKIVAIIIITLIPRIKFLIKMFRYFDKFFSEKMVVFVEVNARINFRHEIYKVLVKIVHFLAKIFLHKMITLTPGELLLPRDVRDVERVDVRFLLVVALLPGRFDEAQFRQKSFRPNSYPVPNYG
jgi:hypothetical protein